MIRLPVVLSIPHGGRAVPNEIVARVCITERDRFDDSDACTPEIYDLGDRVAGVVRAEVARAFVDMNRSPDDRPPGNPDGVVKTATCYERPIYRKGGGLDNSMTETLILRYHEPYHERLRRAVSRTDVRLGLDCHSMAAVGPPVAPDAGRRRPMVCLGSVHGGSCTVDTVERLATCFRDHFAAAGRDVTVDDPFAGGYITQTYGMAPVPWIQVEISRALYLEPPWFDRGRLTVDPDRLSLLNGQFAATLEAFFG